MRRTLFLLACLLVTSACVVSPDCGTARPGGGPPVIETREAELCENIRTALIIHFSRREDWTEEEWEKLVFDARYWSNAPTVDILIAKVREEGGVAMADIVARNIEWTRTRSSLPYGAPGSAMDRTLARAAGHGALAAVDRSWFSAQVEGGPDNVRFGGDEDDN